MRVRISILFALSELSSRKSLDKKEKKIYIDMPDVHLDHYETRILKLAFFYFLNINIYSNIWESKQLCLCRKNNTLFGIVSYI